jgi:hypothetical protein
MKKSRTWLVLVLTIVLTFSMSTLSMVLLNFAMYLQAHAIYFGSDPFFENSIASSRKILNPFDFANQVNSSLIVSFSFNIVAVKLTLNIPEFLIGDAIVIWRTWVLWQGFWPCYAPIIFWVASLGTREIKI